MADDEVLTVITKGGPPVAVLSIGRCGVDIYPLQVGRGLEDVTSFGKFLGGSPTNVAVAAARYGNSAATITAVGADPFGRYVRKEMEQLGVSAQFVTTNRQYHTPVTFCEIFPPDDFPLYFYRSPSAPDLELGVEDIPFDEVAAAPIFWLSATGLSAEPTRSAHFAALQHRGRVTGRTLAVNAKPSDAHDGGQFQSRSARRGGAVSGPESGGGRWTILDLDYRPMFWDSPVNARSQVQSALEYSNVAIGNLEECEVAVGERDPNRAADALLERGVEVAVVKQGPRGTLAKSADERVVVPVTPVQVMNGLGAGDAFGGAFCHALLSGWDLARATQFASAAGAIVASRLECSTAMPTEEEVLALIAQNPTVAATVEQKK